MTTRRRLTILLGALLTVGAVAALLIWVGGRFADTRDPGHSDSIENAFSAIPDIEGVAEVSEQHCRQGDLATGTNCFVRVQAAEGLTEPEQDALATEIGEALEAQADDSLRLMAELHVAGMTVGLSSTPELNVERLAIARGLDALAADDLVAVMWRTENDNLISDTHNESLELTVWSSTAADPVSLYDSVASYAAETVPRGLLTATVRPADGVMPDNLFEWGVDSVARADWKTLAGVPGELPDADRGIVAELSTMAGVRGFSVEPEGIVVIAQSEQLRQALEEQATELLPPEGERQLYVTYLSDGGGLG